MGCWAGVRDAAGFVGVLALPVVQDVPVSRLCGCLGCARVQALSCADVRAVQESELCGCLSYGLCGCPGCVGAWAVQVSEL